MVPGIGTVIGIMENISKRGGWSRDGIRLWGWNRAEMALLLADSIETQGWYRRSDEPSVNFNKRSGWNNKAVSGKVSKISLL